MNQENQVSSKEFNMLAGNLASVWYASDIKGYYLTPFSSSVLSSEYQQEVMRGKVFRIEKKDIQKCTLLQKSSKADLYIKLKEDLRFTTGNLPNKEWLISILYALNLMDQVFLKPKIEDVGLVTKEDLELLKQLDTTLFRSKKPGLLKRTEEQRIAIAEKKIEQKLQRLKQKVDKERFDLVHSTQLANYKNFALIIKKIYIKIQKIILCIILFIFHSSSSTSNSSGMQKKGSGSRFYF